MKTLNFASPEERLTNLDKYCLIIEFVAVVSDDDAVLILAYAIAHDNGKPAAK